jgi:hypothetical protein
MAAKNTRVGSPRHPRVTSTESSDHIKAKAPAKGRLKEKQTPAEPPPVWLAESLASIREKLQGLGIKELERYLMREQTDALLDRLGLDDEAVHFRTHLNLIQQKLDARPDLRAEFEKHALMRDYLRISGREIEKDIVAEQIARSVSIRWSDRRNQLHADRTSAWLTRPDLFLIHVYGRWYKRKKLRLKHVAQDKPLYNAYLMMIKRHPERDLNLPREAKEGYEKNQKISGPRPGYLRIPTAQLSEDQKKRRRAFDALKKRAYRAKKAGL